MRRQGEIVVEERLANRYNVENLEIRKDMNEEQRKIRKRLDDIRITRTETKLVNLRNFDRNYMKRATPRFDEVLKKGI